MNLQKNSQGISQNSLIIATVVLAFGIVVMLSLLLTQSPSKNAKGPIITPTRAVATSATLYTGITGSVKMQDGSCSNQSESSKCTYKPYVTSVLIYTPPILYTKASNGFFYQTIGDQKPVQIVKTDTNGTYNVQLPVGEYSIFIEKDGQPYCVVSNTDQKACSLLVERGQMKTNDITIISLF